MPAKFKAKQLLIVIPLIALVGFIGYRVFQAVRAKSDTQQSGPGQSTGRGRGGGGGGGGGRMQVVQTGVVSTGRINEYVVLTGALKAKNHIDLNPRIQGRIVKIEVDTGHTVSAGSLIAVIEDDEIRQQVERSKAAIAVVEATIAQRDAELSNARAELDRKRQLANEGVISRIELDALETRHRVAQSQLDLARAQRLQSEAELRELSIRQSQTRIQSPINGIIAKRHVDMGAMVNPSTPIVTLVSITPMIIEAQASERDISRIKRGTAVRVTIDSLPGEKFTGQVMRIAPLLDPQTRNGLIEIEIPNRNGLLKGEMFARIELDLGTQRESNLLPRDALVYRGDQPGVYLIESGVARFRPVETGLTQEDKVEVRTGLQQGEIVITRGSNLINDGDRVRVDEESPRAGERRRAQKQGLPE
jgi:RND family efflux transporter MFP subunit